MSTAPDSDPDPVQRLIDAGEPFKALDAALRESGARVTFDRHRSTALPCHVCGSTTVLRDLVQIGVYTRTMGGNIRPGDPIERPLCASCQKLSELS